MSLPVRSPSKELTTSSLPQLATILPTVNAMSPSHQETNNSAPTTPKMSATISKKEHASSPLSNPPEAPPFTDATATVQDPAAMINHSEPKEVNTTTNSPTQKQQAHAPQHDSTAPTSDMNTECMEERSPKRAREEDVSSAFDTPPPKRIDSKANETINDKVPTKKVVPPNKPVRKKPTPKSAAPVPTPARSQPSRSRKAPERLEDSQEKITPKVPTNKKSQSKVFDPIFITTNAGSRLVKADIYHMLLEGPAWTCLSAEQQSTLISMLPQSPANQALLARVNAGETEDTRPSPFTLANDCFRTDVAKFQEDLMNGHLAKTWQAAAEQAVIERAAGEYDQWKAEEAELWWGQKSTQSNRTQ